MPVGTMTLHRFNGDEIFHIAKATIFCGEQDTGEIYVTFEVETERPAVKTLPDTAKSNAQPTAEWTLILPAFTPDAMVGQTYLIPYGEEEDTFDILATLYYYEHELIDNNEVTVISRDKTTLLAQITGMATDVNHYDGSVPLTKIVVEARFQLPEA